MQITRLGTTAFI